MIDDAMVKTILEISNNDKVTKIVEPSLMWHSKIEEWMVRRIGTAIVLIQEEYELRGTNTEGIGALSSKE